METDLKEENLWEGIHLYLDYRVVKVLDPQLLAFCWAPWFMALQVPLSM